MWPLRSLEKLNINFDPASNSFTYTFPPPYFAKLAGEIGMPEGLHSTREWNDFSLYVHIPFCEIDCSFCSLHREVVREDSLVDQYLVSISKEITSYSSYLDGIPLTSIYFGGGTPSLLSPLQINGLLNSISSNFTLAPSVELCLECAPSINRSDIDWALYLEALMSHPVLPLNRVSFGVQSFDAATLRHMGRQGGETAIMQLISVVDDLVDAYNIDVIVGYPSELANTPGGKQSQITLDAIEKLLVEGYRIPSISLYQLWDTESIRVTQPVSVTLLDSEALLRSKWELQEGLFDLGYKPTITSTVIRSGDYTHRWVKHRHLEFRHLGIGSGVYSILPQEFVQRVRNIRRYIEEIQIKQHAHQLDISYRLTDEEVHLRRLIMGLRAFDWIDIEDIQEYPYKSPIITEIKAKLIELVDLGVLEQAGNQLRLAKHSFLISNEVSAFLHPRSHSRKPL